MKVFVHDSAYCNGCYNCQIACLEVNTNEDVSLGDIALT